MVEKSKHGAYWGCRMIDSFSIGYFFFFCFFFFFFFFFLSFFFFVGFSFVLMVSTFRAAGFDGICSQTNLLVANPMQSACRPLMVPSLLLFSFSQLRRLRYGKVRGLQLLDAACGYPIQHVQLQPPGGGEGSLSLKA